MRFDASPSLEEKFLWRTFLLSCTRLLLLCTQPFWVQSSRGTDRHRCGVFDRSRQFLFSEGNVPSWFWAVCAHPVTRICSRMAMCHCRFPICYPPMLKVRKGLDKPDFCRECYFLFPEISIVRACQWKITLLFAPRFLELTRKAVSLTSGGRTNKISH